MTHTSTEQPEALPTPEAVMDQAQVFASAWALYGSGSILEPENSAELAAEAKAELAQMVRRLHARVQELEAQTAHMADLVELADYATKKLEASQAQRVPLSEEQVRKNKTIRLMNASSGLSIGMLMGLVRAIERAQDEARGITQEKQG